MEVYKRGMGAATHWQAGKARAGQRHQAAPPTHLVCLRLGRGEADSGVDTAASLLGGHSLGPGGHSPLQRGGSARVQAAAALGLREGGGLGARI